MRRFSKIFALLLTLCLLVGVVGVFASAAELDATKLESGSTGVVLKYRNDIEDSTRALSTSSKTYINHSVADGADGNHYFRTELNKADNKYITLSGVAGGATYAAPNYKYLVFDADVTADRYVYVDDETQTEALTESLDGLSEAELATARLSFPDQGGFGFRAGNTDATYVTTTHFVNSGSDWYICSTSTLTESGATYAKVNGGIGEWHHITVVLDLCSQTKTDDNGDFKAYLAANVYLDGEFVYRKEIAAKELNTYVTNSETYFRIQKSTKKFSFGIDNVAVNAYTKDYKSTDAVYGLDDFMAENREGTIAFCDDIVYNSKYEFTAAPAIDYSVNNAGTVTKHVNAASVIKAIGYGSKVTADTDLILNKLPSSNYFTVTCVNGATLTYAKAFEDVYDITVTELEGKTVYDFFVDPRSDIPGMKVNVLQNFNTVGSGIAAFNGTYSNSFTSVDSTAEEKYVGITSKINGTLSANTNAYLLAVKTRSVTDVDRVSDYSYYVAEFDFMTLGDYYEGMSLAIFTNNGGAYYHFAYTVSNDGKWYLGNAKTYAASTKLYELPAAGEWTHITYVGVGSSTIAHMYVNGEHFNSVDMVSNTYRMERLCAFMPKNLPLAVDDGCSIYFDSLVVTAYGSKTAPYSSGNAFGLDDYANLGDMTLPIDQLDDIFYNSAYKFASPNLPTVELASSEVKHSNYASALARAVNNDTLKASGNVALYKVLDSSIKKLNIVGGDFVLYGEAAIIYDYENGVLSKKPSYNIEWTNGKDVVLSQESIVEKAPDTSSVNLGIIGSYNTDSSWNISINGSDFVPFEGFDWSTLPEGATVTMKPNASTVKWYLSDGTTLIREETWMQGEIIAPDFATLPSVSEYDNGWYDIGYVGWDKLGSEDDSLTVSVGENASFVAVKDYISSLDVKINYNLGARISSAIYLKKAPASVTNVKVSHSLSTTAKSNDIVGSVQKIDGEEYTKYCGVASSPYSWYPYDYFSVTFDVVLEDGSVVSLQSKQIQIRLADYISKIINYYGCNTPEEALIMNWLTYITNAYGLSNSSKGYATLQAVDDLLTNHFASNASCKNNLKDLDAQIPEAADESLTYKNIATAVEGVSANYLVGSDSIRFALYVPVEYVDANDISVELSFRGIANGKTNQKIGFALKQKTTYDEVGNTVFETYNISGTLCYCYISGDFDIAVYNLNEIVTVSLYNGAELVTSGTYSYAEYAYNYNATLPAELSAYQNRMLNVIKSYRAFSVASREYMVYGTEAAEQ